MKIEIEMSDEVAATLKARLALLGIPESELATLIAPSAESLAVDDLENLYGSYTYPNRAAAMKAVQAIGDEQPRNNDIDVTYLKGGKPVTYSFENPNREKIEAERLNATPPPATKAELQAKLDRMRVCFSMALDYLSDCEKNNFRAKIKALDGGEVTARARELERGVYRGPDRR